MKKNKGSQTGALRRAIQGLQARVADLNASFMGLNAQAMRVGQLVDVTVTVVALLARQAIGEELNEEELAAIREAVYGEQKENKDAEGDSDSANDEPPAPAEQG